MVQSNPASSGSPVQGSVEQFESTALRYRDIESSVKRIDTVFLQLDGSAQFAGEAADEYRLKVDAVRYRVAAAAEVAGKIARIFEFHAFSLEQLRTAAKTAVAQANTDWNGARTAEQQLDEADGQLDWARTQVEYLNATGGAVDDPALYSYWSNRHSDAQVERAAASRRADDAAYALDASARKLDDLAGDERELNELTAQEINALDLGLLADPSLLDKLGSAVASAVDWYLDVLEIIYEALDKILLVIGVILLVAFVIAVIAATGGSAAALLAAAIMTKIGGAIAVLQTVATALLAAKFVIGIVLASDGRASWRGVAVDGAFLALSHFSTGAWLVKKAGVWSPQMKSFVTVMKNANKIENVVEVADHGKTVYEVGEKLISDDEQSDRAISEFEHSMLRPQKRECWQCRAITPRSQPWDMGGFQPTLAPPFANPSTISNGRQQDLLVPFRPMVVSP